MSDNVKLPSRIAKALGRAGGLARARKLTPRQRRMSARKAARARWNQAQKAER